MGIDETSNKKLGRPSGFNQTLRAKILELAAEGKKDSQIAKIVGIPLRTLNYWKTTKQDFLLDLKHQKALADDMVEASLFRRAVGYSHPAEKIMQFQGQVIREKYEEHYPPDTNAAIFWLKNKRPEEWRDKQVNEMTGPNGESIAPPQVILNMPPNERERVEPKKD